MLVDTQLFFRYPNHAFWVPFSPLAANFRGIKEPFFLPSLIFCLSDSIASTSVTNKKAIPDHSRIAPTQLGRLGHPDHTSCRLHMLALIISISMPFITLLLLSNAAIADFTRKQKRLYIFVYFLAFTVHHLIRQIHNPAVPDRNQ